MKTTCATALLVLGTAIGVSQESPPVLPSPVPASVPVAAEEPQSVAPVAPATAPEPVAPETSADTDPAALPPLVRLPTPGPGASDGLPATQSSPGDTPASGQFGWSGEGIDLRTPPGTVPSTNQLTVPQGVVTRMVKPERKGFGGFLSGFANLFNPFAPVSKGVEARNQHWYDANINTGPLPRGLRDERYHEPKTELFVVGLEGAVETPPAPAP